jgi:two-component system NarL family response regulator
MSRLRILIVDDHREIRIRLRSLLEQDYDIVGEAADGCEALDCVNRLAPDLVLLDISMPVMGGFDAAARLLADHPGLRVIFVSQNAGRAYVEEARRIGARGFVLKQAAARDLRRTVQCVLAGESFALAL